MINHTVLFLDDAGFQIGYLNENQPASVRVPIAGSISESIATLKKHFDDLHYDGSPLLLAIPSSWCLCATLDAKDLDRSTRRTALMYRLEEHLPLSAEEITADFILHDNAQALGICAETSKLHELIQSLNTAGIPICHVCPTAILACQHLQTIHPQAKTLLGDMDYLQLHKGKPIHWQWLNGDADSANSLSFPLSTDPSTLIFRDTHCPKSLDPSQIITLEHSQREAALLSGLAILSNASKPWIDLRCDNLVSAAAFQTHPLKMLAAAFAVLLLSLIAITQYRAHQYASLAAQYADQQIAAFKTVMPNQPIPGSIQSRLSSERQRLSNLKGQDTSKSPALNAPSALAQLKTILRNLPSNLRFQIKDLNIRPEGIIVDGLTLTHAQAEEIAASLRQTGQYDVDAPKTQTNAQGVSFNFSAKPQIRDNSHEKPE